MTNENTCCQLFSQFPICGQKHYNESISIIMIVCEGSLSNLASIPSQIKRAKRTTEDVMAAPWIGIAPASCATTSVESSWYTSTILYMFIDPPETRPGVTATARIFHYSASRQAESEEICQAMCWEV